MAITGTDPTQLVPFNTYLHHNRHRIQHLLLADQGHEIHGDLDLTHTDVEFLPNDLTVLGSLLFSNRRPTRIPERLTVGKTLYLEDKSITSLPACLSAQGNVNLADSTITELPTGFRVQGTLDLRSTRIRHLPEGLDVQGDLCLWGTPLQAFPAHMRVGGKITPSDALLDIQAFLATQALPVGTCMILDPGHSHHAKMQMHARLRQFPDLLRIIQSMPPGKVLRLYQDDGGYMSNFQSPPGT